MKASFKVNPLLLLIMTQAWCYVKHDNQFNNLNKTNTSPYFNQSAKNLITPQVWEYVWDHPFFKSSNLTLPPLSIRKLSRHFGLSDDFPSVASKDDALLILSKINDENKTPRAIKVLWQDDFEKDLPRWVVDLLDIKVKKPQIWMDVSPSQTINEDVCNQAIQLGWSWWFTPPDKVSEFKDYFEKYKPLIKFWLINPQSDQWAWPWCDILTKSLVEKYFDVDQERYWINNNKQKNAWHELDFLVYNEFEKSFGGPEICQSFIYAILHELNRVNFLERNF